MKLVFTDGNLTPEEQKARDIMLYLFNPVLKFILLTENPIEFQRFGFNSCRQTAIFGADYLSKLLPDYTFSVYEGNFTEPVNGVLESYIHAYIIGAYKDRLILVDLSRTSKPLVFMQIPSLDFYPRYNEYKDVHKLSHSRINLHSALTTKNPEYLTGMEPAQVICLIDKMIKDMDTRPVMFQKHFFKEMYANTTTLRG